jgi:hypothetical protein
MCKALSSNPSTKKEREGGGEGKKGGREEERKGGREEGRKGGREERREEGREVLLTTLKENGAILHLVSLRVKTHWKD